MKFLNLKVKNFLTISEGEIALNDRGLHIIQGENTIDPSASSNGAGKSSLIDGFVWCLYGITARGGKGDAIVNRAAKKNTEVAVSFRSGEYTYTVTRYRKHKEHKNMVRLLASKDLVMGEAAETLDLTRGTDAETQAEIERILGCSREVFCASIYCGQESMPDLPNMTDRNLKALVEESAGMTRIELAYQAAREQLNAATLKAAPVQNTITALESRITTERAVLVEKEREAADWEAGKGLRVAEAANAAAVATEAFRVASDACAAKAPRILAVKEMREGLAASLSGHSAATEAYNAANSVLSMHQASHRVAESTLAQAMNAARMTEGQINNARSTIGVPCRECGKPHTEEDLSAYIAAQQATHRDQLANIEHAKAAVTAAAAQVDAARAAADAARAAIPDVTETNKQINQIDQAVRTYEAEKADLRRLKMNEESLLAAHTARASEENPVARLVAHQVAHLSTLRTDLAAAAKSFEAVQEEQKLLTDVVALFGPAGVRAHILDTVTPFLNERTAEYLSTLSDGGIRATWNTLSRTAAGELREKFVIDVVNDRGGESFGLISGGEKRKVRLATALALQDLVASRASNPIDLYIGDEIDDALDEAGLERLMVILEKKARDRGTVLVISHNDLADWCDQVTLVSKVGEFQSTVSGSLCTE